MRRSPMPIGWRRKRWSRTCSPATPRRASAPSLKNANRIGRAGRVASPELVPTSGTTQRPGGDIRSKRRALMDVYPLILVLHIAFVALWVGGGATMVILGTLA